MPHTRRNGKEGEGRRSHFLNHYMLPFPSFLPPLPFPPGAIVSRSHPSSLLVLNAPTEAIYLSFSAPYFLPNGIYFPPPFHTLLPLSPFVPPRWILDTLTPFPPPLNNSLAEWRSGRRRERKTTTVSLVEGGRGCTTEDVLVFRAGRDQVDGREGERGGTSPLRAKDFPLVILKPPFFSPPMGSREGKAAAAAVAAGKRKEEKVTLSSFPVPPKSLVTEGGRVDGRTTDVFLPLLSPLSSSGA